MDKPYDILPNGRLTTDRPTNNTQTMLNFAYVKDRRVFLRYGNGVENIDLCDYIAKEAESKGCCLTPEEVMDGACMECDCPVAVTYVLAVQAAELRARLKDYEDQAEQHEPISSKFARELEAVPVVHGRWINASRTKALEQLDHVHAAGGCYCGECLSYLSVNHYQGEGLCVASKRSVSTKDFCSLGRPAK